MRKELKDKVVEHLVKVKSVKGKLVPDIYMENFRKHVGVSRSCGR